MCAPGPSTGGGGMVVRHSTGRPYIYALVMLGAAASNLIGAALLRPPSLLSSSCSRGLACSFPYPQNGTIVTSRQYTTSAPARQYNHVRAVQSRQHRHSSRPCNTMTSQTAAVLSSTSPALQVQLQCMSQARASRKRYCPFGISSLQPFQQVAQLCRGLGPSGPGTWRIVLTAEARSGGESPLAHILRDQHDTTLVATHNSHKGVAGRSQDDAARTTAHASRPCTLLS